MERPCGGGVSWSLREISNDVTHPHGGGKAVLIGDVNGFIDELRELFAITLAIVSANFFVLPTNTKQDTGKCQKQP